MQLIASTSAVKTLKPRRAAASVVDTHLTVRLGAWVCGEPAWDPDFDRADFFVLLPIERMVPRYAQHFLGARTAQ